MTTTSCDQAISNRLKEWLIIVSRTFESIELLDIVNEFPNLPARNIQYVGYIVITKKLVNKV